MVREIERLARDKCAGCGRTFWNNFRLGAAAAVVERLDAQRKATCEAVKVEAQAAGSLALVRVNSALAKLDARMADVNTWQKKHVQLQKTYSRATVDPSARALGREAGKSIRIQPPAGSIGNRTLQLA
jgi:maltoporin